MGEKRALTFSRALLLLACLSLVACVLAGALPPYAIIALLTVIPLYLVYGRLKDSNRSEAYLPLMGASTMTTMRCGGVLILSLLVQGIIQAF